MASLLAIMDGANKCNGPYFTTDVGIEQEYWQSPCERFYYSYPYKLSGCTLQSVSETVDLGVSLTSNLSWNTKIQTVVNKANKIVGFFERNVGPGNKEVFSCLYKVLVIPIPEYAVPLWSPYLQKSPKSWKSPT